MVKISGASRHLQRLKGMRNAEMRTEVGKAIYAAASIITVDAAISITTGSVSGKGHVPSAPGEAPNADTRLLDKSIVTNKTGELTAESAAEAPYAAALEFGTSKMEARPFMNPAAARGRPKAERLVKDAVNRALRKS